MVVWCGFVVWRGNKKKGTVTINYCTFYIIT